jgi:HEAT repeat protein
LDPPRVAEWEQAYRVETEFLKKVENVYRIADASTPEALRDLQGIYFGETDIELRVRIVGALSLVAAPEIEPALAILRDALKPGQPEDLREAALGSLQRFEAPSATALWQALMSDPNPEVRELAEKMIEFRRETATP